MKLFLSSQAISATQGLYLAELVGKNPSQIKLALIENAADTYNVDSQAWVIDNRKAIQGHGFDVKQVDLKQYQNQTKQTDLQTQLAACDVIWLGGGNSFYLRWLLKITGADDIITQLVERGTVYGGGSAGAIVAGPTLKYFEAADDPGQAPEAIFDGLRLTDTVVVPHIDNQKYASIIGAINDQLKKAGYKTAPLTDAQALIVNGQAQSII